MFWQLGEQKLQLGAPAELVLWIKRPPGEEAPPPDPAARLAAVEGLALLAGPASGWQPLAGGLVHAQPLRIQWMRPGPQELPPLEWKLGDRVLRTQALRFEVESSLPKQDKLFPELADDWIAEPPAPALWPWLLGAGLSLALLLWLWLRRRAPRLPETPSMPPPPPRVVAFGRLRELSQLLERGEIDSEYLVVELAQALRSWMQHGLGFHALERTTEEFLFELRSSAKLPREIQYRLSAFLEESDLIKFAGQHASLSLCRGLLERARELIDAT